MNNLNKLLTSLFEDFKKKKISYCVLGNYSDLPSFSKLILSLGMLLGRLELFAVLILFFPSFWKN